ncbi:hypothetical protein GGR54DRAFT_407471 [Hypoxylon sp. NC1633]|nr:hypothetical protein GGR54DRAFT_407471 [Hypoxylon sp. NC1633]
MSCQPQARFVPDGARLFEFAMPAPAVNGGVNPASLSYEESDLNEITRRQMDEDISAYRYDLDYCAEQLHNTHDLTPQEIRTFQVRVLDCGHNIRQCQHRVQRLDGQARKATPSNANHNNMSQQVHHSQGAATPTSAGTVRRKRPYKMIDSDDEDGKGLDLGSIPDLDGTKTTNLQRLGYWSCRLCISDKYLNAGVCRAPSVPCKGPLKDISKIFNHCLDMHTEQLSQDRCVELGDALDHNRGPFEYWLTHTRGQELEDPSTIDNLINILQSGILPDALRRLNRAAQVFPNNILGVKM